MTQQLHKPVHHSSAQSFNADSVLSERMAVARLLRANLMVGRGHKAKERPVQAQLLRIHHNPSLLSCYYSILLLQPAAHFCRNEPAQTRALDGWRKNRTSNVRCGRQVILCAMTLHLFKRSQFVMIAFSQHTTWPCIATILRTPAPAIGQL